MTPQNIRNYIQQYQERLRYSTSYVSTLRTIIDEVNFNTINGRFTRSERDHILKELFRAQVGIESYRRIDEAVEKSSTQISFDGPDDLAAIVAAMKKRG